MKKWHSNRFVQNLSKGINRARPKLQKIAQLLQKAPEYAQKFQKYYDIAQKTVNNTKRLKRSYERFKDDDDEEWDEELPSLGELRSNFEDVRALPANLKDDYINAKRIANEFREYIKV